MATDLERQESTEVLGELVRRLVAKRGWTERLTANAYALIADTLPTWEARYARAYTDGHNVHHLTGVRLAHYAHCYADICDETGLDLSFEFFWPAWDAGDAFEGTPGGNWHCIW